MTREQELMDIIEYSNDEKKKQAAIKELHNLKLYRIRKCNLGSLYGSCVTGKDNTIDIRDVLQVF